MTNDQTAPSNLARQFVVPNGNLQRLDACLAQIFPLRSRAFWQAAIRRRQVLVNNRPAVPGSKPPPGSIVQVAAELFEPPGLIAGPSPQPLSVLVQTDNGLLIIDKPAGLPCHPNQPGQTDTLANYLAYAYSGFAQAGSKPLEGGLLNRLDTDSSGLVLAATSAQAWQHWHRQVRDTAVSKTYLAIAVGDIWSALAAAQLSILAGSRFVTDWPIAHHATKADRAVAVRRGTEAFRGKPRPALTKWTIQKATKHYALLGAEVRQAQFHQIRVHAAALGCPLASDKIYGQALSGLNRQALHAQKICLPALLQLGLPAEVQAPIPPDLLQAITVTDLASSERRA